MTEYLRVKIGRETEEIAQETAKAKKRKREQLGDLKTEWYAYFKNKAPTAEEAFTTANSGLYMQPARSTEKPEDINFLLNHSRDGSVDLGAYPENYLDTAIEMEETQEVLEDYETRAHLSREVTGKTIKETLEELENGSLEAQIQVADTTRPEERSARIAYRNGDIQDVYCWHSNPQNKELKRDLEILLKEQGLLRTQAEI